MNAFTSNDPLLDAIVAEAEAKQDEPTLHALADKLQEAGAESALPLLRRWASAFRKWQPRMRGEVFGVESSVSDLERRGARMDMMDYARQRLSREAADGILRHLHEGRWYAVKVVGRTRREAALGITTLRTEIHIDPLEG